MKECPVIKNNELLGWIGFLVLVIQNLTICRMIRLGPFSAIDIVATVIGAFFIDQLSRDSPGNRMGFHVTLFIFLILGEVIHVLLGIHTPITNLIIGSG